MTFKKLLKYIHNTTMNIFIKRVDYIHTTIKIYS